MSIFSFRSWFQTRAFDRYDFDEKASATGNVVSQHLVGRPVWSERDYQTMAREAYVQNAVSFRCVKMIATAAASTGILMHNARGKEIDDHPLLDLLRRPSPMFGGAAMMEAFFSYLLLSGNGYLEAVGPDNKPPLELWPLRSDRMKVLAGKAGIPSGYEYNAFGQKVSWPVDQLNGKSEILHVKEFNPLNDWYGMSRVDPAAFGVDRHNAASAHNKALLDNGARPSGAMIFEPMSNGGLGPMVSAPPEIIKAAEQQLMKRHSGPQNAGRPLVLSGKVKWEQMGLAPKDMDFEAGKDDAARDICLAWGVPHMLIVKGSATFNNVAEAKLQLWEETVLPLLDLFFDGANNGLTPRYEDGLSLSADLDSISALEPRRSEKRKSTTDLLEKGVIDADEAREALQYGPRKPNTVKKIDSSVLTALVAAVDTVGILPLHRYLLSVSLIDEGTTEQDVLNAALDLIEANPPEVQPPADLANTGMEGTKPAPKIEDNQNAPKA